MEIESACDERWQSQMSQILDEAESRDSQLNLRAFYTVYTTQPQPLLHSLRAALL